MKTIIKLICTIAFLCTNTSIYAQELWDDHEFNNGYLEGGFGYTAQGAQIIQGGISLQTKKLYFKLNMVSIQTSYEKDRRHKEDPVPGFSSLGLMAGKSLSFLRRHQLQVGTGIALIHETVQYRLDEPGYYMYHNKYSEHVTAGLPAEVRYNCYISKGIGLYGSAYGNVNAIRSFAGLTFGVMFGMF